MKRFSAISFVVVLFSQLASAAPIEELFDVMKDSGAHFEVIGMVCEKAAIYELERDYPAAQYEIVNGIEYNDGNRTIGELDVVIFEKASRQAVLVGEVKCWKSLEGALNKAHDQRQRFQRYIGKKINMIDGDRRTYSSNQFKNVRRFVAISQAGGKRAGFDIELENSLNELMEVRGMLMTCQNEGRCARKN